MDGFDAFIVPYKYLNIYAPSAYAMGACWWDFWVPYTAIKKKIPVYFVKEKIAFHKNHLIQYNQSEWKKFGEYFRWHEGLDSFKNIEHLCSHVYGIIKNKDK